MKLLRIIIILVVTLWAFPAFAQISVKLLEDAERGDVNAQVAVGLLYQDKRDYDNAIKWLTKAAEQSNILALRQLVSIYSGDVRKDTTKALYWTEKAAEQGDTDAQFSLGRLYLEENNKIIQQDYFKSAMWLKKAADGGHVQAKGFLGLLYITGQGVIRDKKTGCDLLREAAVPGEKQFIEIYNEFCID